MFCLVMEGPGEGAGLVRKLRKGNSYRLTMRWLNSNGHVDPNWYCWQAQIDGLPKTPSYESYSGVRLEGNETIVGDGWIAENGDGLLTLHVLKIDISVDGLDKKEGGLFIQCRPDDSKTKELTREGIADMRRVRIEVGPTEVMELEMFRIVASGNLWNLQDFLSVMKAEKK